MEKYYKISESKLLELLARDWHLTHLERTGVNNWEDDGAIYENFEEDCAEAGLIPDEDYGYYNYTYIDLAKTALNVYQEVEP